MSTGYKDTVENYCDKVCAVNKQKCNSNMDKADVGLMESSNSVEPEHTGSVLHYLFVLIEHMSTVFDVLTWAVTQVKC